MPKNFKSLEENILKSNPRFLILLLVVVFAIFGNVIGGEFLQADDIKYVVNNPVVRSLSLALRSFNIDTISNGFIYKLFGMSAWAFHVKSLLIHTINAYLLYLLVSLLLNKRTAALSSLVFAVHPAVSEAVLWIFGSAYLFYTLFSLLTIYLFVRYRKSKQKMHLYTSIAVYLIFIGLTMKPWVITTPLILVIIDQYLLRTKVKVARKKLVDYATYFILMLVYALYWIPNNVGTRVEFLDESYRLPSNGLLSTLTFWLLTIKKSFYLLLFPKTLSFFTDGLVPNTFFYVSSILVLTFLILVLVYTWKTNKTYFGLILAIYAAVLPAFSPIEIAVHSAERYFYLSTAFFAILVVNALLRVKKLIRGKQLSFILLSILFILYSTRVVFRTNDWKADKNIWVATQKTAPKNFKSYNNLGNVYLKEGNLDEAFKNYRVVLALKPDYAIAVHNIGLVYISAGNLEEGKKFLLDSFELDQNLYISLYRVGLVELSEGNTAKAKELFEQTLEVNPTFEAARETLNSISTF